MKVVLLAGGFGSRISEESQFKPKPMIEIGGMPILWHIMKEYGQHKSESDETQTLLNSRFDKIDAKLDSIKAADRKSVV